MANPKMMATWENLSLIKEVDFVCGHCNNKTSSKFGYSTNLFHTKKVMTETDRFGKRRITNVNDLVYDYGKIYICSICGRPNYIRLFKEDDKAPMQVEKLPMEAVGNPLVEDVPENIVSMYEEARQCATYGAYTGTLAICKKLLIYMAIDRGADKNKIVFTYYLRYLLENRLIPVEAEKWITYLIQRAGDQNYKIELATQNDASKILYFTEMTIRNLYELKNKNPAFKK